MSANLRPGLPDLPPAMLGMPVDDRGYPVPFFVATVNGKPDHRIVEPTRLIQAVAKRLCWICGRPLNWPLVSVIGPMCGINRISAEPPSHHKCAAFSVQACPFLSRPHARRREAGMPDSKEAPAGHMLLHNPKVSLLWFTDQVQAFKSGSDPHSLLFELGDPHRVEWWTEGRLATRAEAVAAIDEGLPRLLALCENADDAADIYGRLAQLRELLPAEAP